MVQASFVYDSFLGYKVLRDSQYSYKIYFLYKTLISVLHSDTWNTMCVLCNYIMEMII